MHTEVHNFHAEEAAGEPALAGCNHQERASSQLSPAPDAATAASEPALAGCEAAAREPALAGFGESDLDIEVKENALTIRGEKRVEQENSTYLHRGIAARSFERRFQLADYVVVKGATLENGLLHVDLERELPEAMKPRTIEITTKTDEQSKVIDSQAAA